MSQIASTRSIDFRETSFAGPYDLLCEGRYNPNYWRDDAESAEWELQIGCMPGEVFIFHGDKLIVPMLASKREQDKMTSVLRQICHLLVERIEAKGLQETCQSLVEFYQYYNSTGTAVPMLAEPRTSIATTASRSATPAFVFDEE